MIKVATVFSGIGAFEYALRKMNIEHKIVFACDCGDRKVELNQDTILELQKIVDDGKRYERVNEIYDKAKRGNRVKDTYLSNFEIENNTWFTDIRFVNGKPYENQIDIFVGGSPCQSFSLMGKRKGLDDEIST